MPPRRRSPTGGQANFYINNCDELRVFQDWSAYALGKDGGFAKLKSAVEKRS
jgi:hypothetical protein